MRCDSFVGLPRLCGGKGKANRKKRRQSATFGTYVSKNDISRLCHRLELICQSI